MISPFRSGSPKVVSLLCVLALLCVMPALMTAQDVASLTGVVTDASGAVVTDVQVHLVDTKTNEGHDTTTNEVGVYTFTHLDAGPGYRLTFVKDGFDTVTVPDIYLGVGTTHTQNAKLTIGKTSETVEVRGEGSAVSLNTSDATVGNSFDMGLVHELPVQVRDSPATLMTLQPGVVTAPVGADDANQSRDGAVTGSRTDQGNVTLDGLDVNDFAGGFSFQTNGNAPVDSIQEFRGESANPLAAEGRGGGAQINLVTKGGTNLWHGSAYEYHRNTVTEANNYFNNLAGIERPKLIRNQFGASIGGPAIKDKLFFFFNYQGRRDAREDSPSRTVPLDVFRDGNIAYNNNSGGVSIATPADILALDPAGIGEDTALLDFINGRYPHSNDSSGGDQLNTGRFRFNAPVAFVENDYVTRIDYNLNSKMKVWGRVSVLRETTGDDSNFSAPFLFPGDPITHSITDKSWSYVLGHTWTLNNTMVNQFVFGETRQVLGFPTTFNPPGTFQYSVFDNNGTGGGFLTAPYSGASSQARTIPVPIVRDDFTWVRGKHTLQFGGTFKTIKSTATLVSDFNDVTMGLGGGLTSLSSAFRPADIATDATSLNLWDSTYTFLLGRFADVSSTFNNDASLNALPQGSGHTRNYRYYETEVYGQDSWRLRNDLTLTYGLRYQYYSVPYEVNGLEAIPNTSFNDILLPRITNGQNGIAGTGSDPTAPNTFYNLAGKANHAAGFYAPNPHDFAPRFSFAYNPSVNGGWLGRLLGDRKTVIRGGAGVVYDHPGINALNFFQDQNTYVLQNSTAVTYGFGESKTDALVNDPRFTGDGVLPPGTPAQPTPVTLPYGPFVDPVDGPFGTASGQGLFNYAIDSHLKTPYSLLYSFGIQRELPGNFLLDMTYVNRQGRRLLAQSDAGQVIDFKDPASGQTLSQAFAALSQQVRQDPDGLSAVTSQPFFENQMNPQVQANYGAPDCSAFGVPNCAFLIAAFFSPLPQRGDIGDTVQALDANFLLAPGVGLAPQFATDLYMTNKSYSSYNGLLTTLHKKFSHGLQFDFNYTYSHSIDNISAAANEAFGANGSGGIICDVINLGACRGNSDFDATHAITGDWLYELPVGRGKTFGRNMSRWLDEAIGGWQISAINTWRTGFAFNTVTSSFPISFANNVPAIFNGDRAAIKTSPHFDSATGQVQLFSNPDAAVGAFSYPTGLQTGSRNILRGPHYSNFDIGIAKHFPIKERLNLEFRADAFNAFNHTNFGLPGDSATADISLPVAEGGNFGVINSAGAARVLQFALRLDF